MSIVPRVLMDKYCFIQCPPERCNCKRGNPIEAAMQDARWKEMEDRILKRHEEADEDHD